MRFALLPGQRHDGIGVPPLIEDVAFDGLIAGKAFDRDALAAELGERGAKVAIPQHPARAKRLKIDLGIHKRRHLVESPFGKLKELKRIALRAGKADQGLTAMICLAAAINSRLSSTGPIPCAAA